MPSTSSLPALDLQPDSLHIRRTQLPGRDWPSASLTSAFAADGDPRGDSYALKLDKPIPIKHGSLYYLHFEIDSGLLELSGATVANETDYDYPLPLRVDNNDAFGGIYRGDFKFAGVLGR